MQGWLFITYICIGSLFALTGLRQFFVSPLPDAGPNLLWFFAQVAPLLLPLPGLLRGSIRSTFLLCLGSLLYFVHGVVVTYDGTMAWMGAFEIGFAVALCAVTAFLVRKMREAEAS